jgi:hypothetical protein
VVTAAWIVVGLAAPVEVDPEDVAPEGAAGVEGVVAETGKGVAAAAAPTGGVVADVAPGLEAPVDVLFVVLANAVVPVDSESVDAGPLPKRATCSLWAECSASLCNSLRAAWSEASTRAAAANSACSSAGRGGVVVGGEVVGVGAGIVSWTA